MTATPGPSGTEAVRYGDPPPTSIRMSAIATPPLAGCRITTVQLSAPVWVAGPCWGTTAHCVPPTRVTTKVACQSPPARSWHRTAEAAVAVGGVMPGGVGYRVGFAPPEPSGLAVCWPEPPVPAEEVVALGPVEDPPATEPEDGTAFWLVAGVEPDAATELPPVPAAAEHPTSRLTATAARGQRGVRRAALSRAGLLTTRTSAARWCAEGTGSRAATPVAGHRTRPRGLAPRAGVRRRRPPPPPRYRTPRRARASPAR